MLVLIAAIALLSVPPRDFSILFIGNSHTRVNDVPGTVKSLLEATPGVGHVTVRTRLVTLLNGLAPQQVQAEFSRQTYNVVVLQGASLSSSHHYYYSQDGGIAVAKAARALGARVLLYAEWSRRGWDESDFIVDGYREIATPTNAEIIDVPHVFDIVHKQFPTVELWQPDGNHATPAGSGIAAHTIYRWILGLPQKGVPPVPQNGEPSFLKVADAAAINAYRRWHPQPQPVRKKNSTSKRPARRHTATQ